MVLICISILGILTISSASFPVASHQYGQPYHFLIRQVIFNGMGLLAFWICRKIKLSFWQQIAPLILVAAMMGLVLVLIPGVTHAINGSRRWLSLGPVAIQVSEVVKLAMIIYVADFLSRRQQTIQCQIYPFLAILVILVVVSGLLLLEPDFGATLVVMVICLSGLFLAGARLLYFGYIFLTAVTAAVVLAFSAPYRLKRLTTFLNPWAHASDSGYQLTHSLIAFGRGGLLGRGLGGGIEKYFYLPESHTDFIFSVFAEEFGGIAGIGLMVVYAWVVFQIFNMGQYAKDSRDIFGMLICTGVATWIGMQVVVNFGVCMGVLPTKGLTLPLMSYGGSSLVILWAALGLVFRVHDEHHQ
jgi:cell division protein FtsW